MNKNNSLIGVDAARSNMYFKSLFMSLPNPNMLTASAGQRTTTFDTVMTDAHVSSCVQSRKSGVLSQQWEIQSHDSKDAEDPYLEFIENIFKNLNISQIASEILNATMVGFSALEIYWSKDIINDRQYMIPHDVVGKPQSWFFFDQNNMLRLNVLNNYKGELLHARKWVIVQHNSSYDNPYGEAILSKCLWPVVFKKGGMTFWLKFTEKFGMPHFLGRTDRSYGSEDFNEFIDQMDDLIQDASAAISKEDSIEILNPGTSTNVNIYKELLEFCNTEISKAILSQTLTTEIGNTGSYAASATHGAVRQEVIDADKAMVEDALNQLIRWIIEINFGKNAPIPKFIMFDKEDVDKPMAEVAEMLTRHNQLQFKEDFYINRFGFLPEEFEVVKLPTAGTVTTPTPPAFADGIVDFAEAANDQILIDAFSDRGVHEGSALYLAQAKAIQNYLSTQKDNQSAIDHIAKLLPQLDTKAIETKLTNILFMADVIGRLSAKGDHNG